MQTKLTIWQVFRKVLACENRWPLGAEVVFDKRFTTAACLLANEPAKSELLVIFASYIWNVVLFAGCISVFASYISCS